MRKQADMTPTERSELRRDVDAICKIVLDGKRRKDLNEILTTRRWVLVIVAASIFAACKVAQGEGLISLTGLAVVITVAMSFYALVSLDKKIKDEGKTLGLKVPCYRGDVRNIELHNSLISLLELKYEADLEELFVPSSKGLPQRFTVPEGMVTRPFVYSYDPFLVLVMISPPYQ